MRPGVSRVVVEIIILVIAVALALLIFSPISSYIFGAMGRTSTVGGTSTIQVLSISGWGSANNGRIYIKNLGPNDLTVTTATDFQVFINQAQVDLSSASLEDSSGNAISGTYTWSKDSVIVIAGIDLSSYPSTSQWNVVIYGPGNTMTQYLYSP